MTIALLLALLASPAPVLSDHGDTPLLNAIARPDAMLTDLHAFVRGNELVLAVCTNPAIPPGVTSYVWPSDVTFDVCIDTNAGIRFDVPSDLAEFGGTLDRPGQLREKIVFRVRADAQGVPQLTVLGQGHGRLQHSARFFSGLRDDPFIRGPRIGRNVAAFVISVPVDAVVHGHRPLALWATAAIDGRAEPCQDLAGRSLRSMLLPNDFMNTEHPRDHWLVHGVVPDVMIYDTSRPAAFPNGRELADDVVDLVGVPAILANDAPFPSANDVPFLATFPYLAAPQ